MKSFFGKAVSRTAAALAVLVLAGVTTTAALASGSVTLMTPPAGTDNLVLEGKDLGSFPVYNGQAQLMFSWTPYWAPYWPTYPNPKHTDKAYKVAIWQNTTPLAETPTWVELHTSHHWIDDANPTRFTFDTLMDTENPCQDCPSIIVVQAETIQNVVDANGDSAITYAPVDVPNASGVSAVMKSGQFLIRGYTRIQDVNKDGKCPLPPNLQWACAFF